MASLLASSHPSLLAPNPNPNPNSQRLRLLAGSISFRVSHPNRRRCVAANAASGGQTPDEWGEKARPVPERPSEPDPPRDDDDEWGREATASSSGNSQPVVSDEWGEAAEPEAEEPSAADPPIDEDEWGGNGAAAAGGEGERREELKRCLVDTVYGSELGFRASSEVRAEVLELVNQLEASNPTPAPVEAMELLDGNWILLFGPSEYEGSMAVLKKLSKSSLVQKYQTRYTASSELLPLLAVGATPLLKVKKISQEIDTKSMTIVNATTLSSPFALFSFSATASFEVRSPSRIQVQFKEGSFQPPEILSSVDLPEQLDIFGQKISLAPVQQSLNPIQQAFANIARTISGQPPLKVPILRGNRVPSWLLTTYLDKDMRISKGDGGLFILAKEGSSLFDQL